MGNGGHAAHHRGDEETDQVGLRSGTGEAMVEAGNNLPQIHPPGHQPGESGVWCLGRQGDRDLIGSKRRRSTPDEDVGTQIGAVTPDHRSALSADFSKSLWVLEQIFEDSPAHERTDIPVDHGIIGEVETQTKPLEGLDCANPDESHESVSLLQGRDRSRQLAPACQPPVLPKASRCNAAHSRTKASARRGSSPRYTSSVSMTISASDPAYSAWKCGAGDHYRTS